ncbi:MAG: tail fiber domain-containing protein [Bdellovibrionales bacterium]
MKNRGVSSIALILTISLIVMVLLAGSLQLLPKLRSNLVNTSYAEDVDNVVGAIGHFLAENSRCNQNWVGGPEDLRTQALTRTILRKPDNSAIFETIVANPNANYGRGTISIAAIRMSGFIPSSAGALDGVSTLTVDMQKIVDGQLKTWTRNRVVSVEINNLGRLTSCIAVNFDQNQWRMLSGNQIFRQTGSVGIQSDDPSATFEVRDTSSGSRNSVIFGSLEGSGGITMSINSGGPSAMFVIPENHRYVFNTNSAFPPVTLLSDSRQLTVGYALNEVTPYRFAIKSTDGTSFLNLSSATSAWSFRPTNSNQTLELGGSNVASTFIIDHMISGGVSRTDVRIGGDDARPANDYAFWVNGTAGGTSAWQNLSDRRLKAAIAPLSFKATQFKSINAYTYRLIKMPDKRQVGLIAQEIASVPELSAAVNCATEYCTVSYAQLIAPLVSATQDLADRQDRFRKKIKKLESHLD